MKTVERHRYKDKKIFKTRRLTFDPYRYSEANMSLVMGSIRKNLTPDLLSTKYREDNKTNPMFGHCYHSTQALYYLMDTDSLIPMSAIDYRNDPHWWLQDGDKIYDITADQYYSVGKLPPYENGKPSKWYGWKQRPHQRSLNLIVRVLGSSVVDEILEPLKCPGNVRVTQS
jgi:hypothetical protein